MVTLEYIEDDRGVLWELDLASGQFAQTKHVAILSQDYGLDHVADFDRDGDLDSSFVLEGELTYYRNDDGLLVDAVPIIPPDNRFFPLSHVADIDQDGDPDVVSAARGIISFHENRLPGDANNDNEVDFADFLILSENFGTIDAIWSDGDFDSNGSVAFDDFLALAHNFGNARLRPR